MTSLLMLPLGLDGPAVARARDPETSHLAAAGVRSLTARHRAVWEILRSLGPSTDAELVAAYDRFQDRSWWVAQTASSIRSRRALLAHRAYELVVATGAKRPSPNGGHPCRVFAAVNPDLAARHFAAVGADR